ncbi:MAG TPA: diacylglycerol kinase family protein, partial [Acidimicrobiia bacterium]
MRILLIVNATASSVTARARVVIAKALAADHELTVAETTRRGHAERLAHGAANDGFDVVVAMGGDGTLNEAANGLGGAETALAPLPGGSTNVFARALGYPKDTVPAASALLRALRAGNVRRAPVGTVNGRR